MGRNKLRGVKRLISKACSLKMETLSNENCFIEYNVDKKEIFGRDKTDHFNDPAFYNTRKRGLQKAWKILTKAFTPETTMYQSIRILDDNGIRCHSWCMVD